MKWAHLTWAYLAQELGSDEEIRSFCTLNYGKMAQAVIPLKERMEKTNHVKLIGPDTDLTFYIPWSPWVGFVFCEAHRN